MGLGRPSDGQISKRGPLAAGRVSVRMLLQIGNECQLESFSYVEGLLHSLDCVFLAYSLYWIE